MFLFTNYSVKLVNSTNHSLLDLDGFQHNYFAVIGNHNDVLYEYLQMELPSSFGDPSYLIDLKNQDGTIHGGLFTGYENLAVLTETTSSGLNSSEYDYQKFFKNSTKDVTFGFNALGPGNYNFNAILFKSQ